MPRPIFQSSRQRNPKVTGCRMRSHCRSSGNGMSRTYTEIYHFPYPSPPLHRFEMGRISRWFHRPGTYGRTTCHIIDSSHFHAGTQKRAESDAIMVGTRTALLDNPALTVRNWYGHNPVRIVMDRNHSLPQTSHLSDNSVSTLVFTEHPRAGKENLEYITLNYQTDILPQILYALYQRNLQSLMIEGGRILLESFIRSGIWDEVIIEKSDKLLYSGVKAPEISDKISYSEEKHFCTTFRHYLKRNT